MLYMLDTNIVSYLIKGSSPQLQRQLAAIAPERLCISVITQAELLYGLKKLPITHRLHIGVNQLLKLIKILPLNAEAANFYAEIRHQLTTKGQCIGDMDMIIAAHSLSVEATLVTNNVQHFERIKLPLTLINWV